MRARVSSYQHLLINLEFEHLLDVYRGPPRSCLDRDLEIVAPDVAMHALSIVNLHLAGTASMQGACVRKYVYWQPAAGPDRPTGLNSKHRDCDSAHTVLTYKFTI